MITSKDGSSRLNAFNREELLTILQKLIQQKSENPPGQEEGAAKYVKNVLEEHGIKAELSYVKPGRPNVYARLKGKKPGPTMIYNGHLDVVPAGTGWMYDPYEGVIKNGKLYGRGSADMKSGVAAMLYAAIVLQRMGRPFAGELLLFFNVDEERTNLGMRQFLRENIAADYAVISEPTHLKICIGHRGCARYRLHTQGVAEHTGVVAHSDEDNAIYKMAKLIDALEELSTRVAQRKDAVLGSSSLTVTQIKGGLAPNIVPDHCEIEIERRVLPRETKESVHKEIEKCVKETATEHMFDYELENYLYLPASAIPQNDPFVNRLNTVIEKVTTEKAEVTAFHAFCEAPFFSVEKGIPTIIFGPGGLRQAHTKDEYVEVNEVITASQVFIELCRQMLR